MDVSLFDYHLPPELIAQTPLSNRSGSKMMLIDRTKLALKDDVFSDITNILHRGDVLVRNDSRVIPARLFGVKRGTGAHIEVLLLNSVKENTYECIIGNAKAVKVGSEIVFLENVLEGKCIAAGDEGLRVIEFAYARTTMLETLEEVGQTPLPPYIKERLDDPERYQTIYSKHPGSAAAPTAGLHFTREIVDKLIGKGVIILDITLHVGLGTFRPVKVSNTKDHLMHHEYYEISDAVASELNSAKSEGRRVIAVGTTSLRAMEANYRKHGRFVGEKASTDIFIVPGSEILSIDGLLTNFHLPKSTLLMLISAFVNREFILEAYHHAIEHNYRFFSFGDCMIIL